MLADRSREGLEGSLFNSYYMEFKERAPLFSVDFYLLNVIPTVTGAHQTIPKGLVKLLEEEDK